MIHKTGRRFAKLRPRTFDHVITPTDTFQQIRRLHPKSNHSQNSPPLRFFKNHNLQTPKTFTNPIQEQHHTLLNPITRSTTTTSWSTGIPDTPHRAPQQNIFKIPPHFYTTTQTIYTTLRNPTKHDPLHKT
ncbi:hypothetical protein KC19_9G132200 [Ceratodon purpureus]|uniref:Uncharacterized protein n=1 Tax=Ceratodon purpureus TaxID=3225 RepID=A0A8T0GX06_CERPU|nr:hypothetical protein KC19_9G132200 [Ceratodon purpureus]